jgi:hypothetical protein
LIDQVQRSLTAEQLGDHQRIDGGAAASNATSGGDELVDIADAIFQ